MLFISFIFPSPGSRGNGTRDGMKRNEAYLYRAAAGKEDPRS